MRVFIAIAVGEVVRDDTRRLRERVRAEWHDAERALRWVDPQQMHLTLRFLGEIEEVDAQRVVGVFLDGLAGRPFRYVLAAPSWFPNPARPRVLVREVTDGRDEVASMLQDVDARLRRVRVEAEADAKPFRPHVTLARVREGQERAVRAVPADWWTGATHSAGVATTVDRLTVVHSQLTPRGPVHRALVETALTGVD